MYGDVFHQKCVDMYHQIYVNALCKNMVTYILIILLHILVIIFTLMSSNFTILFYIHVIIFTLMSSNFGCKITVLNNLQSQLSKAINLNSINFTFLHNEIFLKL